MKITLDLFIQFVTGVVMGAANVPLTDWLKNVVGVEGKIAFVLAYAIALGLALVGVIITGEIGEAADPFAMIILVTATGQAIYKSLNPTPQS